MFDGSNLNTLSLETQRTSSSTARQNFAVIRDMTRLSEHILRVTDVLCLSTVTIRGLLHDVRPSYSWVKRLLHGTRLSFKKSAK